MRRIYVAFRLRIGCGGVMPAASRFSNSVPALPSDAQLSANSSACPATEDSQPDAHLSTQECEVCPATHE